MAARAEEAAAEEGFGIADTVILAMTTERGKDCFPFLLSFLVTGIEIGTGTEIETEIETGTDATAEVEAVAAPPLVTISTADSVWVE